MRSPYLWECLQRSELSNFCLCGRIICLRCCAVQFWEEVLAHIAK